MINIKQAYRYCCEEISNIENYDEAVNSSEKWECHHRREIIDGLTHKNLKELGLYYDRPASELIFLTEFEHRSLHQKGLKHNFTEEHRRNIGISKSGKNNPNYGKERSMKFKLKIGKAVEQIDSNSGNVIKKWDYMRQIQQTLGFSHGRISECCNGKRKTAYGYVWRFAS